MAEHAVALPERPPSEVKITEDIETITDRYVFRRVFASIQSFLPVHMVAFQQSATPAVRQKFKRFLTEEIKIYDRFLAYGQLKGWVLQPPS